LKKGITTYLLIAVFSLAGGVGYADPLTIPNTFVSGAKAKAADVNANFQAVKNAVDNNDARFSAFQLGNWWNSSSSDNNITITTASSNVLTLPFPADKDGAVIVTAAGYFQVDHVLGTADAPRVSLTQTSGTMSYANYFTLFEIPKDLPSGRYHCPFSITGGFLVTKGINTIYMVANVYGEAGYSTSQTIGRRQLTGIVFGK
jgi:hypothetical protein